MKKLLVVLMVGCSLPVVADSDNDVFEYEDEGKTVICGLLNPETHSTLTIPPQVVTVRRYALADASHLTELVIEGGNPKFEINVFPENSVLTTIDMGSGMTEENMRNLLRVAGKEGNIEIVDIQGCVDNPTLDFQWDDGILKVGAIVRLPAALVDEQTFDDAMVYGHFVLTGKLVTFCGKQTFYDIDDGSNMLFYVPTRYEKDNKRVYMKRVHNIVAGQGVLIHNAKSTASHAYLPRQEDTGSDDERYYFNMLVGAVSPTTITPTDGDKTNLVLYQGRFHRTTGGTLGANKAYLQLSTSDLTTAANAGISVAFDDEADGLVTVDADMTPAPDAWYTLGGQRITALPSQPGVYLHQRKVVVVK